MTARKKRQKLNADQANWDRVVALRPHDLAECVVGMAGDYGVELAVERGADGLPGALLVRYRGPRPSAYVARLIAVRDLAVAKIVAKQGTCPEAAGKRQAASLSFVPAAAAIPDEAMIDAVVQRRLFMDRINDIRSLSGLPEVEESIDGDTKGK